VDEEVLSGLAAGESLVTPKSKFPLETPSGDSAVAVAIEDKLGATTDQERMTLAIGNQ